MESLSYDRFKALACSSRRAFHLEQRDTYNVAAEDEPFGRWLRGEPDDYIWHQDWLAFLRTASEAGVQIQRVRLVSTPHTDYTRWGMAVARVSTQAGEDIRYLPRHLAARISVPDEDYWLFEDDKLILSVFSGDGRTGGFTRETSPDLIRQCAAVRDQVWDQAIPSAQYAR
jgi:hypothetical protein